MLNTIEREKFGFFFHFMYTFCQYLTVKEEKNEKKNIWFNYRTAGNKSNEVRQINQPEAMF